MYIYMHIYTFIITYYYDCYCYYYCYYYCYNYHYVMMMMIIIIIILLLLLLLLFLLLLICFIGELRRGQPGLETLRPLGTCSQALWPCCGHLYRCKLIQWDVYQIFQAIGKDASDCTSGPQVMLLTKSCVCGAAGLLLAGQISLVCLIRILLQIVESKRCTHTHTRIQPPNLEQPADCPFVQVSVCRLCW